MYEERNEKNHGCRRYLKHHTRFCHEFNLPLPFQKMPIPGLEYDDEESLCIEETDIGNMMVYERRYYDDPYNEASDDYIEEYAEDLSTFYVDPDQGGYYITTMSILTNLSDVDKDDGTKSDDKIGLNSDSNDQDDKSDKSDEDIKKSKKGENSNKKGVRSKRYNSDSEEEQYSEEEHKNPKKIKGSTKSSKRFPT